LLLLQAVTRLVERAYALDSSMSDWLCRR
jgi:hypothetical protein